MVGVQAARAIGRLLQCNVGLRQLRLDLAPVLGRREAAVTVAQGLRQNTSLTELPVAGCPAGSGPTRKCRPGVGEGFAGQNHG